MKVLEKLTWMASTGFTGTPVILGTALEDIMRVVVKRLNLEPTKLDKHVINLDARSDRYTGEFYAKAWDLVLLPEIMCYFTANCPKAWFIKLYLDTKNKA